MLTMKTLLAMTAWSGWFWKERCETVGRLALAASAKHRGDTVAWWRHRAAARASEARELALLFALEMFCASQGLAVEQALATAGVKPSAPALAVGPDRGHLAFIGRAMAEFAEGRKGVWS